MFGNIYTSPRGQWGNIARLLLNIDLQNKHNEQLMIALLYGMNCILHCDAIYNIDVYMMTSLNGNDVRLTGPFSNADFDVFFDVSLN